jgi:hypothetical protein
MKSIKDLREQYNLITEKEEAETKKLAALVRAGLFDAKKLTSLKRALDKPVDKMTAQEKRMLLNLLDALMSEVLSNQPVYQKVKQNVMKEAKDYYSGPDPRVQRVGYPSQKEAPSVLLLKRKAIRVFPDGQKVALYYAQAIDKYVSIPYNEIGINEEAQLDEFVGPLVRGAITLGGKLLSKIPKRAPKGVTRNAGPKQLSGPKTRGTRGNKPKGKGGKRGAGAGAAGTGTAASLLSGLSSGSSSSTEPKYFQPKDTQLKATLTRPERTGGSDTRAERERQASLRASKAMTNESTEINLNGNCFVLNNKEANKVVSLYESLNTKNKQKMIKMMNESEEQLNKIVSFAVRQ